MLKKALFTPPEDPDITAWAATVSVSSGRVQANSRIARQLKSAGLWPLIVRWWWLAGENSLQARTCWKSLAVLNPINIPGFTSNRGFTSDGVTSYLKTGFIPSSAGTVFTLNSASLFSYGNAAMTAGSKVSIGGSSGPQAAVVPWATGGTAVNGFMNRDSANGAASSVAAGDALGLTTVSRTASNVETAYKRAVAGSVASSASESLPTVELYGLAFNSAGTPSFFTDGRQSLLGVAAGLTASQVSQLNQIVQNGMAVIPGGAAA